MSDTQASRRLQPGEVSLRLGDRRGIDGTQPNKWTLFAVDRRVLQARSVQTTLVLCKISLPQSGSIDGQHTRRLQLNAVLSVTSCNHAHGLLRDDRAIRFDRQDRLVNSEFPAINDALAFDPFLVERGAGGIAEANLVKRLMKIVAK